MALRPTRPPFDVRKTASTATNARALLFNVQTIDRESGSEKWLTVRALDANDAIRQLTLLGLIVGQVHAISKLEPLDITASSTNVRSNQENALPSEAGAIALAWLGLLFGPLAIGGLVWGGLLLSKTNRKKGTHSLIVGIIMTVLWGLSLLIIMYSSEGYYY